MRMRLTTAGAIAAFLVAAPAFAQDAASPAPATPELAPMEPATPDISANPAQAVPLAGQKFLAQQGDGELFASQLIGTTVYNPADEALGDVNDILFTKEGHVDAIVIGVGGFLGIGEKSIAVSLDTIVETTDADGNVKLVLDTTREELDAAPEFVTTAMLKQQEEQKQMEQITPDATAPPALN
jgi:hypothetical protein